MDAAVEAFLETFGGHLVREDFDKAGECLAPWLGEDRVDELRKAVQGEAARTREVWSDMPIGEADSVELDTNPLSAADLREEGTPLPEEITVDNFLDWCCLTVQTDEGEWSLYDFWCTVVRTSDGPAIGYYEVSPPD